MSNQPLTPDFDSYVCDIDIKNVSFTPSLLQLTWSDGLTSRYHAAWLADRGEPCSAETSMAKLLVCETAEKTILACQRVLGAYGLVRGMPMERYVRDILVFNIAGGSSAIQKNNIANRLGLAR